MSNSDGNDTKKTTTMKRLIVCYDGTSNNQKSHKPPTNVARISRLISRTDRYGVRQMVHYVRGIGSGLGLFDKVSNKIKQALGNEIGKKILAGLRFLSEHYEAGDEIYLIGFSRGAFTARCLAQLINDLGLVASHDKRISISQIYRKWVDCRSRGKPFPNSALATVDANVPIEACAVWDTVAEIRDVRFWKDKSLSFVGDQVTPNIKHAIQALAIDEQRSHFAPEVWQTYDPERQTLDQSWFRGTHSDVGGGNGDETDNNFANVSLVWMISKLALRTDLKFNFHFTYNLRDLMTILVDPLYTRATTRFKESLPDSRTSFWAWLAKTDPRHSSWPLIRRPGNEGCQAIHWSVQPENSPQLFSHKCPALDGVVMQPGTYQGQHWWTNFKTGVHIPQETPTQLEIDMLDQVGFTSIATKLRVYFLDQLEKQGARSNARSHASGSRSSQSSTSVSGASSFYDHSGTASSASSRTVSSGRPRLHRAQPEGLESRMPPRRIARPGSIMAKEYIMDDASGAFRFHKYSEHKLPPRQQADRSNSDKSTPYASLDSRLKQWIFFPALQRYRFVQTGEKDGDPMEIYWARDPQR